MVRASLSPFFIFMLTACSGQDDARPTPADTAADLLEQSITRCGERAFELVHSCLCLLQAFRKVPARGLIGLR